MSATALENAAAGRAPRSASDRPVPRRHAPDRPASAEGPSTIWSKVAIWSPCSIRRFRRSGAISSSRAAGASRTSSGIAYAAGSVTRPERVLRIPVTCTLGCPERPLCPFPGSSPGRCSFAHTGMIHHSLTPSSLIGDSPSYMVVLSLEEIRRASHRLRTRLPVCCRRKTDKRDECRTGGHPRSLSSRAISLRSTLRLDDRDHRSRPIFPVKKPPFGD